MTDTPKTDIAPRTAVTSGGPLAALVPQNLDDAFRMAKALSLSGDMVPKHFQGKPEATMAAIVRGMEIGLAPMQALSNICVINGRASLWGDALPALMQRAGHHIDVEVTGEGDKIIATATLTRGDSGKTVVRTFSVEDAKKAGLWGKQGPWQQYPKRMLLNRARAWAVRDGASDAMMGLQVAEEMQDAPPPRDVTPRETGPNLAQRLEQSARQTVVEAAEATVEPQAAQDVSDIPEAELADPAPASEAHWTESIDTDAAFPGSEAWEQGVKAAKAGMKPTMCPHENDPAAAADWLGGFYGARRAKE